MQGTTRRQMVLIIRSFCGRYERYIEPEFVQEHGTPMC